MMERLASAIRSVVTRGKVATAVISGRTSVQVTILADETKQNVELLHPYGWFAVPDASADVVLLQVLGSRDHLVAVGGDVIGQSEPSAAGEFGAKHKTGAFVHFTNDGKITLQDASGAGVILQNNGTIYVKGALVATGDITDNVTTQSETMAGQRAVFNGHYHQVKNIQAGSGTVTTDAPTQQEV